MKIRNGFVSNSSSSSFIISNKDFKTVRELATYMIEQKFDDYDEKYEYFDDVENKTYKNKSHYLYTKNIKNVDENDPITFQSCNYDTYIKKIDDCYLVSTCNNEDWNIYQYCKSLSETAKQSLIKLKNNYNESDDIYQEIVSTIEGDEFYQFGNDYYSLDYELIGIETSDYCPNCLAKKKYVYMWDTKKHGIICLECNKAYKRKDKLDEINKSIEK